MRGSKINHVRNIIPEAEAENRSLREASAEARALLGNAVEKLLVIIDDEPIMVETSLEIKDAVESAVEAMRAALRCLEAADLANRPTAARPPGGPTRQQGQFLAFIREYMMRNEAGVAPTHAALQRFFNLTAPSVNSMLIRLERRGFILRVPGKARAIELIVDPDWIPQLGRPFKF